ncbi:SDR family NAD(P)-dependent oxidoreductase [Algiphilus sp.]|uniref:SDR family NAD(P)-dependent oxidoreductase n=1 Tax=Algiphilus sp. TaxID=1872431 RepID=UPI001CA623F4|nr:SDR family oxidoreductase [Algiphilus acroporae]MCI5062436.1 SDR family oxidoreductase [Algiphilus sp.]MCR9090102.1 SDR family oxidoreductase [Pseudomonadota bacterium]
MAKHEFHGKVVFITGAGGGIGKACAQAFAATGATVVASDVQREQAQAVVDALPHDGRQSHQALALDVRETAQWQAALEAAMAQQGRLDCLVNNAGIEIIKAVTELEVDEIDQLLAINVRGVLLGCKHAVPHLATTKGSIVNLASVAGLVGWPLLSLYCASKGAVVQISRSLAQELRDTGIRVNALCPAVIQTDMGSRFLDRYEQGHGIPMTDAINARQGRLGTVEEVADCVLFLASDAAAFVNGAALPVDNGLSAG